MARIWVFEMHGPESLTPSPNACKYCDIVSHYNVRQYSTVMQPLQDFASRVDWLAPSSLHTHTHARTRANVFILSIRSPSSWMQKEAAKNCCFFFLKPLSLYPKAQNEACPSVSAEGPRPCFSFLLKLRSRSFRK